MKLENHRDHVLVVGGGTMGAGIAQTFVEHGYRVTLKEIDPDAAARAQAKVIDSLARTAERGHPVDDDAAQQFDAVSELDSLSGNHPDLVVESVPEAVQLKSRVLADLSERFPLALLATNTSALSIDTLALHLARPDRFLGMHFFNPVPRSRLIEVVRGSSTSAATIAECHAHAVRLEKVSIEVRDSPGFATSRLGIAIGLEAMRMVEEAVASPEDIDLGMVHGYKFPIGPLALSDMVGLDVRLAIADHLAAEFGDRFEAPALLRRMVERGDLGAKSGQGFYRWDPDGRRVGAARS